MGMIRSESDRISYKQRLLDDEMNTAKREYQKELKSLEKKREEKSRMQLISQATKKFNSAINEYISRIQPRISDTFLEITENIIEAENDFAIKQLQDRQEALQQVLDAKQSQSESVASITVHHIVEQIDEILSNLLSPIDKYMKKNWRSEYSYWLSSTEYFSKRNNKKIQSKLYSELCHSLKKKLENDINKILV